MKRLGSLALALAVAGCTYKPLPDAPEAVRLQLAASPEDVLSGVLDAFVASGISPAVTDRRDGGAIVEATHRLGRGEAVCNFARTMAYRQDDDLVGAAGTTLLHVYAADGGTAVTFRIVADHPDPNNTGCVPTAAAYRTILEASGLDAWARR